MPDQQRPEQRQDHEALAEATAAGLPAVVGDVIEGDTGGYHHYADRDQVSGWLSDAGLELVDEEEEWLGGYGYRHLFLRSATRSDAGAAADDNPLV